MVRKSVTISVVWINQTIAERFGILSDKAEQMKEFTAIEDAIENIQLRLEKQLSDEGGQLLHQMVDLHGQMNSMYKQWFYVKGVQDGIQLLIFLLLDDGVLA